MRGGREVWNGLGMRIRSVGKIGSLEDGLIVSKRYNIDFEGRISILSNVDLFLYLHFNNA